MKKVKINKRLLGQSINLSAASTVYRSLVMPRIVVPRFSSVTIATIATEKMREFTGKNRNQVQLVSAK